MATEKICMGGIDKNQYDNMVLRLKREDNVLYHPRTKELIIGCTQDARQSFITSNHSAVVTPAQPYHRLQNRTCGCTLRTIFWCDYEDSPQVKQIVDDSVAIGKPTNQYKTVWYSKGQRRR